MGNFPIAVYLRLMEGLKERIPNEKERKRHIIEEQLYMIELNKKNCFIAKQVFDIKDEYHTNICNGNTLEISTEDEFKVEKFDIIMGNPPYQKENKKSLKARGGKNRNLYLDFVKWAYEHISDGGYLVFIHPQAWRKIGSKYLKFFLDKTILYLKLNYGGNFFQNVSVKTDFYVVCNNPPNETRTVINYEYKGNRYDSLIRMERIPFIPNILNFFVISILKKIDKYGIKYRCIMTSDCHKT